jgi:exosortase A-associated hydrolase 2
MFFFAGSRGRRLLGFIHLPPVPAQGPGLVYCHPFGEEKMASHPVSVITARRIRDLGVPVLRFDFSGCGDSEAELDEVTPADWLEDLRCACEELKRRSGAQRIALWGLRLGASLALAYAATAQPAFLILWQPLPDLEQYIKQFLRQKQSTDIAAGREGGATLKALVQSLEAGESVEVIGYPISGAFYKGFLDLAKTSLPSHVGYPVLVATASLSDEAPMGPLRVAESLEKLGHRVERIHAKDDTFWDRQWRWEAPLLTEATAGFVASATGRAATTSLRAGAPSRGTAGAHSGTAGAAA